MHQVDVQQVKDSCLVGELKATYVVEAYIDVYSCSQESQGPLSILLKSTDHATMPTCSIVALLEAPK